MNLSEKRRRSYYQSRVGEATIASAYLSPLHSRAATATPAAPKKPGITVWTAPLFLLVLDAAEELV
jgi:hypothetical protein